MDLRNQFHAFVKEKFLPWTYTSFPEASNPGINELLYIEEPGRIQKIYIKYGVEKGEDIRGGRVHTHIHMKVEHFTKIWIIGRVLKQWSEDYFNHLIGGSRMYINIRGMGDGGHNWEEYSEKDHYKDLTFTHNGYKEKPSYPITTSNGNYDRFSYDDYLDDRLEEEYLDLW